MNEELLRAAHSSLVIRWGTDAPYAIGKIRCERVGYAQIPSLVVPVACKRRDLEALIPIARQNAFAWLAERGVDNKHLALTPSVGGSHRTRRFTDDNESSPTFGKDKMGCRFAIHFEMSRTLAKAVDWRGSFGTLKHTWEL